MELILREEAIKCLDGNVLITEQKEAEAVKEYFKMVISRLKALPTIEEREEGEWLDAGMDGEKCSRCGWSIDDTFYSSQFLYCPNCGARMKGE